MSITTHPTGRSTVTTKTLRALIALGIQRTIDGLPADDWAGAVDALHTSGTLTPLYEYGANVGYLAREIRGWIQNGRRSDRRRYAVSLIWGPLQDEVYFASDSLEDAITVAQEFWPDCSMVVDRYRDLQVA